MPSSLNIQTDREIRYTQRAEKKRVEQQKIDRSSRALKRNQDISNEVSREIASISRKEIHTRTANSRVSFSSYF
jgi:hypothetical protein